MPSFKKTSYLLDGEIVLYVLDGAKRDNWNARWKDPSGRRTYIRRSLRTQNLAIAQKRAMDFYNESNVRNFLDAPDAEISWDYIFDKYIGDFSPTMQTKARHLNRRYFREFFSKVNDIYKLDSGTIHSYFHYRANYWLNKEREGNNAHHPSFVTLANIVIDRSVLRKIITRAFNDRLIYQIPSYPSQKELAKFPNVRTIELKARRKRFKEYVGDDGRLVNEYTKIVLPALKALPKKALIRENGRGGRQDRYSRFNLWFWLLTIANTAIRPSEMRKLKFSDFSLYTDEKDNSYTLIMIRSEVAKMGITREVISRDMELTWNRLQKWKSEYEIYWGEAPKHDDYLFPKLGDKSKVRCMIPSVRYFHKQLGIHSEITNGSTVHLTSYSYRSLAISMMLKEKIDVFSVARNAGTAVFNIERWYDVSSVLSHREILTKQIQREKHNI